MAKHSLQTQNDWLLFLYALPARQNTERVNLWRKLRKFGAVALKSCGYVLPESPTQYERCQWLSRQIRDAGGEATLIRVREIEGMPRQEIIGMFNEARASEYKELAAACQQALQRHKLSADEDLAAELEKFQRRFREIQEVDYFNAPAVHDAQVLLERARKTVSPEPAHPVARLEPRTFVGKTWLTRPRPGIDRAGSAWLIRRFIDGKAKFVFGMKPERHPKTIPFDMANVEFSHHGDDCTFETLVKRFGILDRTVVKIAEMVHDADLEDDKFHQAECIGINRVLGGWARTKLTDQQLLLKGIDCFEGLYQSLRR